MHKQHLITLKLRVKQKGGRNCFSPEPFHSSLHWVSFLSQVYKHQASRESYSQVFGQCQTLHSSSLGVVDLHCHDPLCSFVDPDPG